MNILEYDKLFNKSLELVSLYHKGMVDKGGNPYIDHLVSVSMNCISPEAKIAGLLHDILEDTKCTKEILLKNSIPEYIIDIIEVVSRKSNETYSEFIDRVCESNNKFAMEVKLADLRNNSNLTRIKKPTIKDTRRVIFKYQPAIYQISKILFPEDSSNVKVRDYERELCESHNFDCKSCPYKLKETSTKIWCRNKGIYLTSI